MKLVFVPLKDVFKECKGKRQFSIKKDAYRRFSSVSNEMQIGIKKIAALHDAAVALGNTINEMDKYYTQENYKDDAFAKGKTLHQTFLKNLEAFEAVAESYHAAIQEINDKRQLAELKNIEEREGKTFHYYSLAVMISAKQINNLISQEKFDVDAAMKKVSELETLVAQAKEADKGGMNFSFINSAGQYQLEAKKYVRRIRDKVPYSDWDKEQLQDANSSWMVDDSFPRALREYNEMVDDYNSLR